MGANKSKSPNRVSGRMSDRTIDWSRVKEAVRNRNWPRLQAALASAGIDISSIDLDSVKSVLSTYDWDDIEQLIENYDFSQLKQKLEDLDIRGMLLQYVQNHDLSGLVQTLKDWGVRELRMFEQRIIYALEQRMDSHDWSRLKNCLLDDKSVECIVDILQSFDLRGKMRDNDWKLLRQIAQNHDFTALVDKLKQLGMREVRMLEQRAIYALQQKLSQYDWSELIACIERMELDRLVAKIKQLAKQKLVQRIEQAYDNRDKYRGFRNSDEERNGCVCIQNAY